MAEQHSPVNDSAGHETTDAHAFNLFKIGGYLLALIAVTFAAMFGFLKIMEKNPPPVTTQQSALHKRGELPPEPRLQALPTVDMEAYQAWEDSVLKSYTWVDHGTGLVRVPIDSAITMVARKGLPVDKRLEERQ